MKEHNLQDPKNKRKIVCDEKLGKVLPARTDMFKMNKELSKHVFTQGEAAVLYRILSILQACPIQQGQNESCLQCRGTMHLTGALIPEAVRLALANL